MKQTARRPQLAAPLFVFPTLLLALQTGGAGRAVDLPQFPPVQSFLAFMLAGAMVQAVLLAGNSGAIAIALDIEMGFTDRLFAAPISRFVVVLGRLAGTAMLGVIVALWFLAIGLIFGATIEEGVLGAVWIVFMTSATAVAFGSLVAAIALRTGSASIVQGLFPILFVVLFLSSAFFPANLMLQPAASLADYNPLSFIVEAMRQPIISGFSGEDELKGLLSVLCIAIIGLALSGVAVRARAKRG